MVGFEPWSSGVGSDHCVNCPATYWLLFDCFNRRRLSQTNQLSNVNNAWVFVQYHLSTNARCSRQTFGTIGRTDKSIQSIFSAAPLSGSNTTILFLLKLTAKHYLVKGPSWLWWLECQYFFMVSNSQNIHNITSTLWVVMGSPMLMDTGISQQNAGLQRIHS